jgi:hypothetical protein
MLIQARLLPYEQAAELNPRTAVAYGGWNLKPRVLSISGQFLLRARNWPSLRFRKPTETAKSLEMAKLFVVVAVALLFKMTECFSMSPRRASSSKISMSFMTHFEEISVQTGRALTISDITGAIRDVVEKSGCKEGVVTVLSKHSTVGLMINEYEPRFVDDARQFLLKLAPPDYPWLHNDIDNR